MDIIIASISKILVTFGPFFLMLGLLIFVHEMGHFLTAKFFKVRVETFSIGFGKKVFQRKWGETTYCVSLIPLGGYVKMFGDDPSKEVPDEEKPYSFLHQPLIPRMLIVLAGPLVNFFFAILVFAMVVMVGEKLPAPIVGDISTSSAAAQAGFVAGDRVLTVNTKDVTTWNDITKIIRQNPNTNINFELLRGGEKTTIEAKAKMGQNPNPIEYNETVGLIEGLTPASLTPIVGLSNLNSPAFKAGLPTISMIDKINGKEVRYFRSLAEALKENSGKPLEISFVSLLADDAKPEVLTIGALDFAPNASNKEILKQIGFESTQTYLYTVKDSSPADKAGIKRGDKIVEINGVPTKKWEDLLKAVSSYKLDDPALKVTVLRNGEPKKLEVIPEMTELLNGRAQEESRFTIGIKPALTMIAGEPVLKRDLNPFNALVEGTRRAVRWTGLTVVGLVRLVQNKLSPKSIGGVISIGSVASQSFQAGWSTFLNIMGILSINLFLLNLLPIPVLDGGHLVFFTLEALKGKPISLKKLEIAQTLGFVILMSLMAFALFNDVSRLYSNWGW